MPMHQVVAAGGVGRLRPQHLEREVAQLGGQVALVEILERAGRHVPDEHAGHELGDRGRIPRHRAGEDVDLDAAGRHPLGDFDHINIQAAGVAGAWLLERRGMNADGRDPPGVASRHGHTPPVREPRRPAPCSRPGTG